jgi:hypothetical protein
VDTTPRATVSNKFGKDLEERGRGLIEVLFRRLPGGAEENSGIFQPQYPVSQPRFEKGTFRIRVQLVTATLVRSVLVHLDAVVYN